MVVGGCAGGRRSVGGVGGCMCECHCLYSGMPTLKPLSHGTVK